MSTNQNEDGALARLPTVLARSPAKGVLPAAEVEVGQVLCGKYRLERHISTGGMGEVFLATDLVLERPVALKRMVRILEIAPTLKERFLREARTTARIDHPNVVKIFEASTDEEGHPFYAMELLNGQTLSELIAEEKRIATERALGIVLQVLDALDAMHAQEVLHRDLKPNNVMVLHRRGAEDGDLVKVVDFGIAKVLDASTMTGANCVVGTPQYLPPEAFTGAAPDASWDVYAAGCVLYALLTGEEAWQGRTIAELAAAKAGPPPDLRTVDASLPVALAAVVSRAMAPQKEDRLPSAATFRQAILNLDVENLAPGTLIDRRYRVEAQLFAGAHSVIYEVLDQRTHRPAAVKIDLTGAMGERFERAAAVSARIRHESLLHVEHAGRWRGRAYLAMELLDAGFVTLEARWPELGWTAFLNVLSKVANVLDILGQDGLVHRDLSPNNIAIRGDELVKVCDLEFVREPASTLTRSSMVDVLGSPGYIAPETLERAKDAVPGSDQWALGAIVYQTLTGGAPHFDEDEPDFEVAQDAALARLQRGEELRSPHALNATVSQLLSEIVMKALAPRPGDRFATCARFVFELQQANAVGLELPFFNPPEEEPPTEPAPPARKRKGWPWIFGLLLVSGLGAALARTAGPRSAPRQTPAHAEDPVAIDDDAEATPASPPERVVVPQQLPEKARASVAMPPLVVASPETTVSASPAPRRKSHRPHPPEPDHHRASVFLGESGQ